MSRIRSIKPDFFMDEETATLPPDAQLLLIGLWTLADRDGRLEDKVRRIKAQVFPYRDVDVEACLDALALVGVIRRYDVDVGRCIQIVHFLRDQRPHPKETSFGLPGPDAAIREVSRQGAEPSGRVPVVVGSGCGSGSGSISFAAPADAAPLGDGEQAVLVEPPAPTGPQPEDLQAIWNRLAPPKGLQRWAAMSDKRRREARVSLRDAPDLAKWEAWLRHELERPFNLGVGSGGWKADVDWLLRAKTRDLVNDFDPATAAKPAPKGDTPRLPPREVAPEAQKPTTSERRVIL